MFLATEQGEFSDAWRYELIGGRVVGHAAPTPEHGAIDDAVLFLSSVGIEIPIHEIYQFAIPEEDTPRP